MRKLLLPLSATAGLAIAATALPTLSSAEDELPPWQRASVTGDAESCIPIRQIRETHVRDDRTIDFELSGGRIYRNTLPTRCGTLGAERRFAYETSLGRLCSTDIITVLRTPVSAGIEGPRCGLGEFVPIEIPDS